MARTLEEDINLLNDFLQWRATNKGKGGPEEFLVWQGQQAAYQKLEQVIDWFEAHAGQAAMTEEEWSQLGAILD